MALAVYSASAGKSTGGNQVLAVCEIANIASIALTAGEVSTLTMGSGLTFKKIGIEQDSLQRTHAGQGNKSNIGFVHSIKYSLSDPSADLETHANALADASPAGMAAIVLDGNGVAWLVGYNDTEFGNRPLRLETDDFDSGLEPIGDGIQNNDFTLSCKSGKRALPFDATISAAIAAGTAVQVTWS